MKLFYYLPLLLCLTYTAKGEEIEKDTTKIRNVELNEVVVQSFKQQRDLRLEPLSASAVTGTAIQNRNIMGIKEFSSFIPNLFMPDYGSKLTSPVYIRGSDRKSTHPRSGFMWTASPTSKNQLSILISMKWIGSKCCAVRKGHSTAVTRWAASSMSIQNRL